MIPTQLGRVRCWPNRSSLSCSPHKLSKLSLQNKREKAVSLGCACPHTALPVVPATTSKDCATDAMTILTTTKSFVRSRVPLFPVAFRSGTCGAWALVLLFLVVLSCTPSSSSAEELWERWADRALTKCIKLIHPLKGRSKLEPICDNFHQIVEEEMKMMAINTGAMLGKKEAADNIKFTMELNERIEEEPYKSDGDKIISHTAQHFIDNRIVSPKQMKKYFFLKFAQWLMNVAVDNRLSLDSMPQYPDIEDLERRMHKDDL